MTPLNANPLKEIDILWITAGLGCDGESIAMTAATQPSIEDLVLGGIPGIPESNCTIRSMLTRTVTSFLKDFYLGAEGKLDPFILIIEGSVPNELNKSEGYWAS